MKKNLIVLISVISFFCEAGALKAQDVSAKPFNPQTVVSYPKQLGDILTEDRTPLCLPEVDGYQVLKCDFHMHTVFSDGSVWPTTRVEEAFREGLDAMAITDHLEFHHLHAPDVMAEENLNREYEIAKETADRLGVLLIPGAEVTREVPAGHFNVLFLNDVNPLKRFINKSDRYDPSNLEETLEEAKKLGGFILWNHPAYKNPKGIAEWFDIHERLFKKGLIMGIEVANSNRYIPLVQKWAEEKHLTMFSNSDYHSSVGMRPGCYRPMTLVFVKERSAEGIREALDHHRTVAFAQNYLYGEESLLKGLLKNALKTRCLSTNGKQTIVEIENLLGLNFDMELLENGMYRSVTSTCLLMGGKTTAVVLKDIEAKALKHGSFKVRVKNFAPHAGAVLETEISF